MVELFHVISLQENCGCGVLKETYGLSQLTFQENLMLIQSRDKDTEWKLDPIVFKRISSFWGKPSIDLFASRLNFQLRPFVSWKPDPEAFAIDAFSISWN